MNVGKTHRYQNVGWRWIHTVLSMLLTVQYNAVFYRKQQAALNIAKDALFSTVTYCFNGKWYVTVRILP